MAHEDWDLFAIVRSCKVATFTTTTNTQTPPTTTNTTPSQDNNNTTMAMPCLEKETNGSFSFPNLVQPRTSGFQELHQLLVNFNPTTTTTTTTTSSTNTSTSTSGLDVNPNSTFSHVTGFIGQHHHHLVPTPTNYTSIETPSTSFNKFYHHHHHQQQQPQILEQQQQQQNQVTQTSSVLSPSTQPQTPRSRKRKTQQKKMVCHVTAENLSSDLWAWRKYGQKPIKGSPYPRNYYRCSSCKGCAARKQVERSTTEPNMFIVTYTGDHKHAKPAHRNSLAGSTRSKPSTTRLPETQETGSPLNKNNVSPSSSALSPISDPPPENEEPHVTAGELDPETEPESPSDSYSVVLIPNSEAMSDAVLLGS